MGVHSAEGEERECECDSFAIYFCSRETWKTNVPKLRLHKIAMGDRLRLRNKIVIGKNDMLTVKPMRYNGKNNYIGLQLREKLFLLRAKKKVNGREHAGEFFHNRLKPSF